ncbi:MAG: hypothetical protein ACRELS_11010 [Candidatus Rokuibacteriota bacterium]
MDEREARFAILREALRERYQAMHAIRERADKICVWALGVLILIAGWTVDKGARFDSGDRLFFGTIVLVAVVTLRIGYLRDLERGFRTQQHIAATIEAELGLFPPYPETWRLAGTSSGGGQYFSTTYRLLYVGALIFVASLFFNCVLELLGFRVPSPMAFV